MKKSIKKKGFTLIELIVALFIFVLISSAIAAIFANSFSTYRRAKNMQRNLENAQLGMSLLAKTLRTSSVITSDGLNSNLVIYDYSQGKCTRFRFYNNQLITASENEDEKDDCNTSSVTNNPDNMDVVINYVDNVNFETTRSENGNVVGKVTITAGICQNASDCSNSEIWIQSSVSLRDYTESGLL